MKAQVDSCRDEEMLVYVGTYTTGASEGIHIYRMNSASGALELAGKVTGVDNPSFLAVDRQHRHLYAVNEVAEFAGRPTGAVSAFSIDPRTGTLRRLNQRSSQGPGPCHLGVDRTGHHVLVANYSGGSVSVLPVDDAGQLGEATDFIQHHGAGINPERPAEPHAHSITLDPANRYAFVADLGLDRVMIYRFDATLGKLEPADDPWVEIKAGAGPRHFDFHPGGGYAYLINELDSTIVAFAYDGTSGTLREVQTAPALPRDYGGTSHCADIHVSPSGRFLYGSNRGHDSIVAFRIDEATGRLTYLGHEPTQGENPRGFAIDPTGEFLLVANQDTDTIVTFRIDRETGRLMPTGHVARVPTPACLKVARSAG